LATKAVLKTGLPLIRRWEFESLTLRHFFYKEIDLTLTTREVKVGDKCTVREADPKWHHFNKGDRIVITDVIEGVGVIARGTDRINIEGSLLIQDLVFDE